MSMEGPICGQLRSELAQFIDLRAKSSLQAATTYARLWWHLWTCAECAEIYLAALVLADATAKNDLPPLPSSLLDTTSPQPL